MRRTAAQRCRHRVVPHRDSARRHAAPNGRRTGDPHLRQGIAGQARKKGLAERHHALHPPRRGGVPLHPPRPQRQPGADPLAAQGQKLGVRIALEIPTYPYDAEFAQSPAVRKLKLRIDRMFRCRMAATSTASSPSPTIRKYSAARRSVYPTASTSGVSRSKPRYTGITTTYGCWPWRTSISGTASTA